MEALEQRVLLSAAPPFAGAVPSASADVMAFDVMLSPVSLKIVEPGKPSKSPLFQINVEGEDPTGDVELYQNGVLVGSGELVMGSNGIILIRADVPFPVGTHTVEARFDGDVSASVTFTIAPTITSTVLTTKQTALNADESITISFSATVLSVNYGATGFVQFCLNGVPFGAPVAIDAAGRASMVDANLPVGDYEITAVYLGDADNLTSTSNAATQEVTTFTVINLMAVYVQGLNDAYGHKIEECVDAMNLAMLNSLIPVRVDLVAMIPAMQTAPDGSLIPYRPSYSFMTELYRLTYDNDGYMDDVFEWQSYYQADMVTLVMDDIDVNGGTSGIGWILMTTEGSPQCGFTVVTDPTAKLRPNSRASFSSTTYEDLKYTIAHELGHNLGAGHNPIHDPNPTTAGPGFITGRGYRFYGNDNNLYHTIMAYTWDYSAGSTHSQVIPYFSNPDVSFAGVPAGSETQNVAALFRQTAPVIANYRYQLPPPKTNVPPVGKLDTIAFNAKTVTGYGYDRNAGKNAVNVCVSINGVKQPAVKANLTRPEFFDTGSYNHGFSINMPHMANGTYEVQLYVQDAPGTEWIEMGAPQTWIVDNRAEVSVSVGQIAAPKSWIKDATLTIETEGDPIVASGLYTLGDWVTVPVTFKNNSTSTATATKNVPIVAEIWLSSDGIALDVLVQRLELTKSLASNQEVTLTARFQLDLDTVAGNYYVVAVVDSLALEDATAVSPAPMVVSWQFGNLQNRKGNTPVVFTDADGTRVTLQLSGPGTGELTLDEAGKYTITVSNTTGASALRINTAKAKGNAAASGRFTLANLVIATPVNEEVAFAADIKSIVAGTTDITESLTVGAINTLTLGNTTGEFWIGGTIAAKITFGSVDNLTINSSAPISSFVVGNWTGGGTINGATIAKFTSRNTFNANITLSGNLGTLTVTNDILGGTWNITGDIGTIKAKSADFAATLTGTLNSMTLADANAINCLYLNAGTINTIKINGDLFDSNIILLQGMNSMTVGKTMQNTAIRSAGNIGSITVGMLDSAIIFAGINNAVTTLPASPVDFVAQATINSLTIKGINGFWAAPVLTNSYIAASNITTVKMPVRSNAVFGNGPSFYGFATRNPGLTKYTGPESIGWYISPLDSVPVVG